MDEKRTAASVRNEAEAWLAYFRESANPHTAEERWAAVLWRTLLWGVPHVFCDRCNREVRDAACAAR